MRYHGLAAEIRAEMSRKNHTCRSLATKSGIPYAQLRNQVLDARPVTAADLRLIADALDISPQTMIDRAGEEAPTDIPHFVYRAYAEDGALLYVGSTADPRQRMTSHRTQSIWYQFMVQHTIERYETRVEARTAEAEAIRTEFPKFNVRSAA